MSTPTRHSRVRKALIWSALGLALAFAAFNWFLPWLARRGNLNGLIEGVLRSSLTVPVKIEKIDTEPLSELRVTRIRSVTAEARDRFGFAAHEIAISYDPLEILFGGIRNARFEAPELFINLDAELSDIARMPDASAELKKLPRAPATSPPAASDSFLPVTVESTTIEKGKVTLKLNDRELELSNLHLEVSKLGKSVGQSFNLTVEALGGVVRCWGGVDVARSEGSATHFKFHEGRVVISGIDASRLIAWLASDAIRSSWLGPILLKARGKLGLEGSLEGAWPEAVQLSLATHASEVSAAYDTDLGVNEGSLGIHLNAEILGDLETVKFSVSTHGAGRLQSADSREETAEINIEGELRRKEGQGGVLEIAPSVAVLVDAGDVRFSGRVEEVLGELPRLDLIVETPGIDATALISRMPPALKSGLLEGLAARKAGGQVIARAQITGPVTRPGADGSFEVKSLNLPLSSAGSIAGEVRCEWKGLEIDTSTGAGSVESLKVETGDIDVAAAARALGLPGRSLDLHGLARARLETSEQCFPVGSSGIRGTLGLSTTDLDWALSSGRAGMSDVNGTIRAEASFHPQARKLFFSLGLNATASEALAGSFYANLAGKPSSVQLEGQAAWGRDWRLETAQITKSSAALPVAGQVTASADAFRASDGGLAVDASIAANEILAGDAFQVLVSEPLSESAPFLAGSKLDGRAALTFRAEGSLSNPVFWGRLTLAPSRLELPHANLREIEIDLPFELGEPLNAGAGAEDSGFFSVGAIEAPDLLLEGLRLPFRFARGAYSFEPARVKIFGGKIEMTETSISSRGKNGVHANVNLTARQLKLGKIARTFGLPGLDGEMEIDLTPVVLDGTRLESHGTVRLRTFGGEISFQDLTIDNLSKPYADLRLREGRVEHIRLDKIGEAFRFGLMSGVLEGKISDLSFTGGEVSRFQLDVATVPTRGVPQYLNRAAIESIRRVFAGPLGAIEETFFSRFKFADFGFVCGLEDGIFRLRGKYPDGEREYILRARWYQLPQVNIINGRPDQPYDWKTIVTNLLRIYERK